MNSLGRKLISWTCLDRNQVIRLDGNTHCLMVYVCMRGIVVGCRLFWDDHYLNLEIQHAGHI